MSAQDHRARLSWMDMLRGAAVLLVISWHAVTVPVWFDIDMPSAIVTVNTVVSPYRLPLLLVISGMLLQRSLDKPLGPYYEGKARAILWPYLVWTVLTALAVGSPGALIHPVTWIAGYDHLWYLSTLLVCYAVAPMLRRVPGWIVAAALFAVWFTVAPTVPGVANWVWFGAYFFLGSTFARLDLARMPGWVAAALGVVAVGGGVAAVTGPGIGYVWKIHWVGISLAGVAALIWLAPRIPRGRAVRALEAVGRRSIYYYAAHLAVIALAARGLAALGAEGSWPAYLGVLGLGILVPYLLTRMPAARWLFAFGRTRTRVGDGPST